MVTAQRHSVDTARVSGFPVLDRPGLDYLQARPKKKKKKRKKVLLIHPDMWGPFNWICSITY